MSAICKKCGKELDFLLHFETHREVAIFAFDESGDPNYLLKDCYQADDPNTNFTCPECHEVLTHSEEDAIKMLKGEKIE
ncbi:MAG: hypothetical protein ABIF01_02785 [Candidatus Micrarchaeota archaeon]